jgi:hypothetical protein
MTSIIKMLKTKGGRMGKNGEKKGTSISYWWKSQTGKKPLGRPIRRWVDNIKLDLRGDRIG